MHVPDEIVNLYDGVWYDDLKSEWFFTLSETHFGPFKTPIEAGMKYRSEMDKLSKKHSEKKTKTGAGSSADVSQPPAKRLKIKDENEMVANDGVSPLPLILPPPEPPTGSLAAPGAQYDVDSEEVVYAGTRRSSFVDLSEL